MYAQTLVLNYGVPHKVVGWKTAVTNMCLGKYVVVKDYPEILAVIGREAMKQFPALRESIRHVLSTDAETVVLRVPAVVSLRDGVYVRKHTARFSKVNVCARDKFRCQYCGFKLPMSKLTFDHVVPRSRGGQTVWENIVMACHPCNSRKDDRTPEEAGMHLINGPEHVRRPKSLPMAGPSLDPTSVPEEWVEFTVN